jgi:isoaspartyl peptidase/L-asparaginase-like protein (Ntn-hydrolase superfamily)
MRFTAKGKPDAGFAPQGYFEKSLPESATVSAVAVDAKGRIYAAASVFGAAGYGVWVIRVLPAS